MGIYSNKTKRPNNKEKTPGDFLTPGMDNARNFHIIITAASGTIRYEPSISRKKTLLLTRKPGRIYHLFMVWIMRQADYVERVASQF